MPRRDAQHRQGKWKFSKHRQLLTPEAGTHSTVYLPGHNKLLGLSPTRGNCPREQQMPTGERMDAVKRIESITWCGIASDFVSFFSWRVQPTADAISTISLCILCLSTCTFKPLKFFILLKKKKKANNTFWSAATDNIMKCPDLHCWILCWDNFFFRAQERKVQLI